MWSPNGAGPCLVDVVLLCGIVLGVFAAAGGPAERQAGEGGQANKKAGEQEEDACKRHREEEC